MNFFALIQKKTHKILKEQRKEKNCFEKKAKYEECLEKENQCIRDWNEYYYVKVIEQRIHMDALILDAEGQVLYLSSCRHLR